MKITTFADRVTEREGLKESISRAQIGEVLRVINEELSGALYTIVGLMQEPRKRAEK